MKSQKDSCCGSRRIFQKSKKISLFYFLRILRSEKTFKEILNKEKSSEEEES